MYSPVTYFSGIFSKFTSMFMHMPVFYVSLLYNIPLYYCCSFMCSSVYHGWVYCFQFLLLKTLMLWTICHLQCKPCVPCCIQCWPWLTQDRYSINKCLRNVMLLVPISLHVQFLDSWDTTEAFVPFTAFHSVSIVLACARPACACFESLSLHFSFTRGKYS